MRGSSTERTGLMPIAAGRNPWQTPVGPRVHESESRWRRDPGVSAYAGP